ncbi:MAG: hypothetical protein WCO90_09485 [Planctomycetota bacterium]
MSPVLADTTVLVGTTGPSNSTLTGGIKSFAVTGSGSTWTESNFNSDSWTQSVNAGRLDPCGRSVQPCQPSGT